MDLVDRHLDSLYEKQRIEIMQANYVRAKLTGKTKQKLTKLVVANPYTAGLKSLLFALSEENDEKKIRYFDDALLNLFHIKYYYVEAMLLFADYLHKSKNSRFEAVKSDGYGLAKKYFFRHLIFRFEHIEIASELLFNVDLYPVPTEPNFLQNVSLVKQAFLNGKK